MSDQDLILFLIKGMKSDLKEVKANVDLLLARKNKTEGVVIAVSVILSVVASALTIIIGR